VALLLFSLDESDETKQSVRRREIRRWTWVAVQERRRAVSVWGPTKRRKTTPGRRTRPLTTQVQCRLALCSVLLVSCCCLPLCAAVGVANLLLFDQSCPSQRSFLGMALCFDNRRPKHNNENNFTYNNNTNQPTGKKGRPAVGAATAATSATPAHVKLLQV
jgi:hypothetical protein